jgi:hypothetical protein
MTNGERSVQPEDLHDHQEQHAPEADQVVDVNVASDAQQSQIQRSFPGIAKALSRGQQISPQQVVSLQRRVGNQRVQQLLSGTTVGVRRKLQSTTSTAPATDEQEQDELDTENAAPDQLTTAAPGGTDDGDGSDDAGVDDTGGNQAPDDMPPPPTDDAGDAPTGPDENSQEPSATEDLQPEEATPQAGTADAQSPQADMGPQVGGTQQGGAVDASSATTEAQAQVPETLTADPPIEDDGTDNILQLVAQATSSGNTGQEFLQEQQSAPDAQQTDDADSENAVQRRVQRQTATDEQVPVDLSSFLENAQMQQELLLSHAQQFRQYIKSDTATKKAGVAAFVTTENERLKAAFSQATSGVHKQYTVIKAQIQNARDIQVAELVANSLRQKLALSEGVTSKKQALKQAGEAKAQDAKTFGKEESKRAKTATAANAQRAFDIGASKKAQYASYERGGDIGVTATSMAKETASKIQKSGADIAKVAPDDMGKLAQKFRDESKELAASFDQKIPDIESKIKSETSDAVKNVMNLASEAINALDKMVETTLQQLGSALTTSMKQVHTLSNTVGKSIDQAGVKLAENVDQQTAAALISLKNATTTIAEQFDGTAGEEAQSAVTEATGRLTDAANTVIGNITQAVTGSGNALEAAAEKARNHVRSYVDAISAQATDMQTLFAAEAGKIHTEVDKGMTKSATETNKEMDKLVQGALKEIQKSIDEASTGWEKQLKDGKAQLSSKIDNGLAEQQKSLQKLSTEIDKSAEKLESQNWLQRSWSFVKGFVSKFFSEIWKGIKTMLVVALVALAVVVLVAVVIVLAGGLNALVAVAATVIILLSVYGSTIASVMAVVGAVLAAVSIGLAVYKWVTTDPKDDFQRGELVAGAVFEVFSVAVPFDDIAKWAKGVRLLPAATRGLRSNWRSLPQKGLDAARGLPGKVRDGVKGIPGGLRGMGEKARGLPDRLRGRGSQQPETFDPAANFEKGWQSGVNAPKAANSAIGKGQEISKEVDNATTDDKEQQRSM